MNKFFPMTVLGALVAFTVSVNAEAVNVLPGPSIHEQAKVLQFLRDDVDRAQMGAVVDALFFCWDDGKKYSRGSVNDEGHICMCDFLDTIFCSWSNRTGAEVSR